MEAIIISCQQENLAAAFAATLKESFGDVVCYSKGRRVAGGIRHIAEAWLLRNYPECLVQAQALLLFSGLNDDYDLLDEVLDVVVRLDYAEDILIRTVAMDQYKSKKLVVDSGN